MLPLPSAARCPVSSRRLPVSPHASASFSVLNASLVAIGGKAFTEITSAGGAGITLAESGAGIVTSFAGSVYTAATQAAESAVSGASSAAGAASSAAGAASSAGAGAASKCVISSFLMHQISIPIITP
ncbi:hypothetical protein DENSPDRAFT_837638 [Dentipellis sp. KUC8613]|nr:hypothetical protein DENSPDRAFT_837638 [Dentipellis sp. KUC8613]